ncbi:hypothetical protein C3L33_23172, partial [Rhododendron williamsianum]
MDPIPTWVRRLWDIWDLRILVLLSFSLQVILCISGGRRKSISSLRINSVLVWSAYLMADWVATVALSKLSDAEGKNKSSNVLRAVWAPLLLLHLGGPDTITAYSLEDNQLWMRHLMGLVVQLSVAIYVILMSWKNSWFSFMSIPALVVGIIKYGERTWALKSVWGEKYMRSIPFGGLSGTRHSTAGHDYVWALGAAHVHLNDFRTYLAREHHIWNVLSLGHNNWVNIHSNIFWDALEVQMGLMYDLLYTKAAVIYSKGGLIMRCISFGCTVSVLLGLIFQIVLLKTREEDEGNWHEIDIAITGVLILGALALEIYAAVVIFSSNWMMIWVIKQGREEWVKWLSQRFPWLFNKKKNWSQMMGQFDLLGYCLKCGNGEFDRSRSTRIIRSVLGYNYKYEDKWNRYLHKTEYSVHPLVCNAILELCNRRIDPLISDSLIREVDEIWETLRYRYTGGTFSQGNSVRPLGNRNMLPFRNGMGWRQW